MSVDTLSPTSRYFTAGTAELTLPDGTKVIYLARRLIAPPESFAFLREHTVREGERLDHIAAEHLGDPEQFWRICDANAALNPDDLLRIGGIIRITLPEGLPGPRRA
ncbi:LysM peptidoglycan-binding domain-containing protein [Pendulispora rubella]|uniref:LysM peptidoglycan-binding domain-containing protein n=1 Tax=Pendulispora rubella TaxID=2741070 RepID=A0ABZ2LI57_9BACT